MHASTAKAPQEREMDCPRGRSSFAPRLEPPAPETPTIVVGSGKGGVGKSVVSVLIATAVAAQGRRVLLLDGDQNLANLHVLLGVRPKARIESVLSGRADAPELVQWVSPNLWLLAGESGAESLYALESVNRARLQHRLSEVYRRFEVVVVDTGTGIENVVRAATMRATSLLLVTAPEPTALTDAYALIKILHLQLPDFPIGILVNRCLNATEGRDAYLKLATACERFLRRAVDYAGALPEDASIRLAVRNPSRLLESIQSSQAAQTLKSTVLDRLDLPAMARSAE
ncbi:MAG: P-loop NTPase [Gemmatimonadales bacterium]